MKRLPVPKKSSRAGNVKETIKLAVQLTKEPKEFPKPRMFSGKISPSMTHMTGPQVAEKKAM